MCTVKQEKQPKSKHNVLNDIFIPVHFHVKLLGTLLQKTYDDSETPAFTRTLKTSKHCNTSNLKGSTRPRGLN